MQKGEKIETNRNLKQSRIKKKNDGLTKLIETIKGAINLFDKNLYKQELYDISTRKAASKEVSQYLLNVVVKGEYSRKIFREEVIKYPKRFEDPIKRQCTRTFARRGQMEQWGLRAPMGVLGTMLLENFAFLRLVKP